MVFIQLTDIWDVNFSMRVPYMIVGRNHFAVNTTTTVQRFQLYATMIEGHVFPDLKDNENNWSFKFSNPIIQKTGFYAMGKLNLKGLSQFSKLNGSNYC